MIAESNPLGSLGMGGVSQLKTWVRVSLRQPSCTPLSLLAGDPGAAEETAVVPGEPGDLDRRGRRLVPELLLSGHVPHPYLGTAAQSVRGAGEAEGAPLGSRSASSVTPPPPLISDTRSWPR